MDISQNLCNGEQKFFSEMKEGCTLPCTKMLFFDEGLLGCQYLLEILRTSPTTKSDENMVTNIDFKKLCETTICFAIKNGCKVSCAKILMFR